LPRPGLSPRQRDYSEGHRPPDAVPVHGGLRHLCGKLAAARRMGTRRVRRPHAGFHTLRLMPQSANTVTKARNNENTKKTERKHVPRRKPRNGVPFCLCLFFVFSLFRAFVIVFFSSGAFVICFLGTRLANSLHDGPTSSFAARGRADAGSSESEDPANGQSTWTAGYLLRRPTLFYCHSLSARGLSGPRRRALVSSGPDYGCAGR